MCGRGISWTLHASGLVWIHFHYDELMFCAFLLSSMIRGSFQCNCHDVGAALMQFSWSWNEFNKMFAIVGRGWCDLHDLEMMLTSFSWFSNYDNACCMSLKLINAIPWVWNHVNACRFHFEFLTLPFVMLVASTLDDCRFHFKPLSFPFSVTVVSILTACRCHFKVLSFPFYSRLQAPSLDNSQRPP